MRRSGFFLIGLLHLASLCSAASTTLMILPFENATDDQSLNTLQKGMPELLAAALETRATEIHVVEREKLDGIMAEQSLKWENMIKDKGYVQLGQLVQARYILKGSMIPDAKGLRIQAALYDTETTQWLKAWDVAGDRKSVSRLADTLASQITGQMKTPSARLPSDADPQSQLLFMHGMAYYQQNQFPKAIAEFMKVLEKQPRHADAKYWLVKSYDNAGLHDDARVEAKEFQSFFTHDPRVREIKEGLSRKGVHNEK